MSGFWAGAVPPWAIVAGFFLILAAGAFGVWIGWGLGEEHERQCAADEAEAELAVGWSRELRGHWTPPPEVAHEAWTAHVEQALDQAREMTEQVLDLARELSPSYQPLDSLPGQPGPQTELMRAVPDLRTDTAWTRDMAKDMDAWIAEHIRGRGPAIDLAPLVGDAGDSG